MYILKQRFAKLSLFLAILIAAAMLAPVVSAYGADSLENKAVQFLKNDYQKNGIKNTEYDGVGSYAFYILTEKGIDIGSWTYKGKNFREAVSSTISGDISNAGHCSAKLLAQDLAAAKALQRSDLADPLLQILKARQTETGFDSSIFYNIPAFDLLGRVGLINQINTAQARQYILGQQNTAQGNDIHSWGFTMGSYYPDLLVTTKALRALHYLDPDQKDPVVQAAIQNSMNWLKNQQQDDGSFVAGYPGMDDPLIDTAEVILTLKALGMDPASWKSSGDRSGVDYLSNHALNPDGSFGKDKNDMGAIWFLDTAAQASAAAQPVSNVSPPADKPSQMKVTMAVVGEHGDLLLAPIEVGLESDSQWGATVLGALVASGIPSHASTWSWGMCVDSILDVPSTGGGGWMYAVNDQIATKMAEACAIEDGDKIVWYYAYGMGQLPPPWDDVLKLQQNSTGIPGEASGQPAVVSGSALDAAIEKAGFAGAVVLQADSLKTSLLLSKDQLNRISNAAKPLSVHIQGAQFILSPSSLNMAGLVSADAAQLKISAEKLSSWAVQNQIQPTGKLKLAGDIYELDVVVIDQEQKPQKIKQLPDCSIVLTVPRGFRDTAAAGRVAAYRYNEAGQWECVGGSYDAAGGAISFKADHFGKYALLQTNASFTDIDGHWAQKEIEFMAANNYVAGLGDNLFSPDARITRAEFVAIVTRMAGLSVQPAEQISFADVPESAWYREAVDIAVSNGIAFGNDKSAFAPHDPVSREQMAAMLARLLEQKGQAGAMNEAEAGQVLSGLTDQESISSWARMPVAAMVQAKLMAGRDGGRFAPRDYATRAEAAVVLYKVLQAL